MRRLLTDEERVAHILESRKRWSEKRKDPEYKIKEKPRYRVNLSLPTDKKELLYNIAEQYYDGNVTTVFVKSVEEKFNIDLSFKNDGQEENSKDDDD